MKLRWLALMILVLLIASPVLAQDQVPTIHIGESALGPILIGPTGLTLYMFTPDG
jgi:hypothetical protein